MELGQNLISNKESPPSVYVLPGSLNLFAPPENKTNTKQVFKLNQDTINKQISQRSDLHFTYQNINNQMIREVMYPDSSCDLNKYIGWVDLIRNRFQNEPQILKNTHTSLEEIKDSQSELCKSDKEAKLKNISEQRYWQNQIFLRVALEEGIAKGYDTQNLEAFLKDLHRIACSGIDGENYYYKTNTDSLSFQSPKEGDFYRYKTRDISDTELKEKSEKYLKKFQNFIHLVSETDLDQDDFLQRLAKSYTDVIFQPPFQQINNSLMMNILNLSLERHGFNPISHGDLDKSLSLLAKEGSESILRTKAAFYRERFIPALVQTNPSLTETNLIDAIKTPEKSEKSSFKYQDAIQELFKDKLIDKETLHLLKYASQDFIRAGAGKFSMIAEFNKILVKLVNHKIISNEFYNSWKNNIEIDVEKLSSFNSHAQKNLIYRVIANKLKESQNPKIDCENINAFMDHYSLPINSLRGYQKAELYDAGKAYVDNLTS
ncbi:MAG: hypothetical protein MK033_03300 [Candidatus Caenarcaniphilales bacterium]|nr:hypothetical protein [Candidatus Caenarcaniphilales bacterium]